MDCKKYKNLLETMKIEKVTFLQIANLIGCRYQTVSDTANGVTKQGFYFEDACLIQQVLFPKYNVDYLFKRE